MNVNLFYGSIKQFELLNRLLQRTKHEAIINTKNMRLVLNDTPLPNSNLYLSTKYYIGMKIYFLLYSKIKYTWSLFQQIKINTDLNNEYNKYNLKFTKPILK